MKNVGLGRGRRPLGYTDILHSKEMVTKNTVLDIGLRLISLFGSSVSVFKKFLRIRFFWIVHRYELLLLVFYGKLVVNLPVNLQGSRLTLRRRLWVPGPLFPRILSPPPGIDSELSSILPQYTANTNPVSPEPLR